MSKTIFIGPRSAHCLVMSVTQLLTSSMLVARLDWCDPEVSCNFSLPYQRSDMRFVQNFTLLDFQANFFTPSISPNFNSLDLLLLKIRPGFCQKPLLLANSVHFWQTRKLPLSRPMMLMFVFPVFKSVHPVEKIYQFDV